MEDLGQNSSSPLLVDLLRQRDDAMKQLSEMNKQLAAAKWNKRGGPKKAIRNIEQAIKRIDKAIDKERNDSVRLEKVESDQILAAQGIDARSGRLTQIAGMAQSGAELGAAIVGKGGVSSVGRAKAQANQAIGVEEAKTDATKGMSKNVIYGVIAVVVLFILMRKK